MKTAGQQPGSGRPFKIDNSTVLCLVAWPLNESEAGAEFDNFDGNLPASLMLVMLFSC